MLSFSARLQVRMDADAADDDADADAADGICLKFAFLLDCAFARRNPLNAVALLLMI
jgi:hypothetical protein